MSQYEDLKAAQRDALEAIQSHLRQRLEPTGEGIQQPNSGENPYIDVSSNTQRKQQHLKDELINLSIDQKQVVDTLREVTQALGRELEHPNTGPGSWKTSYIQPANS